MDTVSFHKIADEFLEDLSEEMENKFADADVEYLQGVLNIELSDGKQYVINKHEPSKQIWFSSPISGASKFSYDSGKNSWMNNNNLELKQLLKSEMS